MNQNGAPGLPPGIGQAIRNAVGMDAPGLRPTGPQTPPPLDTGNLFLCLVETALTAERIDLDPDVPVENQDYPGSASAVPAGAVRLGGDGRPVRAVAFTVRTPSTTFTAFWETSTARDNLERLKAEAALMPPIIQPPDVASAGHKVPGLIVPASAAAELGPDLRRLRVTLRDVSREPTPTSVVLQFDAAHLTVVIELIEKALYALTGLVLPGQ